VLQSPYGLQRVTIHEMGWQRNLGITFDLRAYAQSPVNRDRPGYITMGDNNAYDQCSIRADPCSPYPPYDTGWIVAQGNILGKARGEIPWFGLIKLTLDPGKSAYKCCNGWGDPLAPRNSWDSLLIALPLVFGSPFLFEGGRWAWERYVTPRIKRRREARSGEGGPPAAEPPSPR